MCKSQRRDCCQAFEIRYIFFEGHLSEGQTRDNFVIQELAKKKKKTVNGFQLPIFMKKTETEKHM